MERIRYRKGDDGSLTSVQTFKHPDNGAEYLVRLNGQSFSILDAHNNNLVSTEHTDATATISKVKKLARTALEKLGVKLEMGRRGPRVKKLNG
jgi:hypothetical protein